MRPKERTLATKNGFQKGHYYALSKKCHQVSSLENRHFQLKIFDIFFPDGSIAYEEFLPSSNFALDKPSC